MINDRICKYRSLQFQETVPNGVPTWSALGKQATQTNEVYFLDDGFHSFQEHWKSWFPEFTITTKAQSDENSFIFCIPWNAIEVLHICSCTPCPRQNVSLFTGLGLFVSSFGFHCHTSYCKLSKLTRNFTCHKL